MREFLRLVHEQAGTEKFLFVIGIITAIPVITNPVRDFMLFLALDNLLAVIVLFMFAGDDPRKARKSYRFFSTYFLGR